jgi:para-aminobenzoate synthetase/4-amino-4-deoxychorismate lyase
VGYFAPGRRACFNVAIRTVLVDRERGTAEYGIGSGIVWDSERSAELDECIEKARVLRERTVPFSLLESLLWEPGDGYFLLERHIGRMRDSAAYFSYAFPEDEIRARLTEAARGLPPVPHKVRLLMDRRGVAAAEAAELPPAPDGVETPVWKVARDTVPVQSRDPFLYHKTTRRSVYDAALARHPGCDDVLLHNERGELTESCRANVAARFGSRWVTPPVGCGLLAGTYRAELLARGELEEGILTAEDLDRADEIVLLNSVRRSVQAVFVDAAAAGG